MEFLKQDILPKEEEDAIWEEVIGGTKKSFGYKFWLYFEASCQIIFGFSAFVSLFLIPFTEITLVHSTCLFVISYIFREGLKTHEQLPPAMVRHVRIERWLELITKMLKEKDK